MKLVLILKPFKLFPFFSLKKRGALLIILCKVPMEGNARREELCPRLLDLIPKDRDRQWPLSRDRGQASHGSTLELRLGLGPPGDEDLWTLKANTRSERNHHDDQDDRQQSPLLSLGYFAKTTEKKKAFSQQEQSSLPNTAVTNSTSQKRCFILFLFLLLSLLLFFFFHIFGQRIFTWHWVSVCCSVVHAQLISLSLLSRFIPLVLIYHPNFTCHILLHNPVLFQACFSKTSLIFFSYFFLHFA